MNTIRNIYCLCAVLMYLAFLNGCSAAAPQQGQHGFFTSGSREADQRAEQRMAAQKQLKDADPAGIKLAPEPPKSLYDRLGGEQGMVLIVDDLMSRVLADPRVNWERKGVKRGGFTVHRGASVEWDASQQNVQQLKKHLVQFLSLSTGGPSFYDGKDMKSAHQGMHVSNPEFDAAVGDLKATLDKLSIADKEQRELLAIIESTRTQIVEER